MLRTGYAHPYLSHETHAFITKPAIRFSPRIWLAMFRFLRGQAFVSSFYVGIVSSTRYGVWYCMLYVIYLTMLHLDLVVIRPLARE